MLQRKLTEAALKECVNIKIPLQNPKGEMKVACGHLRLIKEKKTIIDAR